MTRKNMSPTQIKTRRVKCPKCGYDETEKDGRDIVCSNCGSLIRKG